MAYKCNDGTKLYDLPARVMQVIDHLEGLKLNDTASHPKMMYDLALKHSIRFIQDVFVDEYDEYIAQKEAQDHQGELTKKLIEEYNQTHNIQNND